MAEQQCLCGRVHLSAAAARAEADRLGLSLVPSLGKTGFKHVKHSPKSVNHPFVCTLRGGATFQFATAEQAALEYARQLGPKESAREAAEPCRARPVQRASHGDLHSMAWSTKDPANANVGRPVVISSDTRVIQEADKLTHGAGPHALISTAAEQQNKSYWCMEEQASSRSAAAVRAHARRRADRAAVLASTSISTCIASASKDAGSDAAGECTAAVDGVADHGLVCDSIAASSVGSTTHVAAVPVTCAPLCTSTSPVGCQNFATQEVAANGKLPANVLSYVRDMNPVAAQTAALANGVELVRDATRRSGFTNVSKCERSKGIVKYEASRKRNGKRIRLGSFDVAEQAALAVALHTRMHPGD
jgi:hypothetical protein